MVGGSLSSSSMLGFSKSQRKNGVRGPLGEILKIMASVRFSRSMHFEKFGLCDRESAHLLSLMMRCHRCVTRHI